MDNLRRLNLAQFSAADIDTVEALHPKLKLLRRWFRYERISAPDEDCIRLYSGDRSDTPYTSLLLSRFSDGRYVLVDRRTGEQLAEGRTADAVLGHLPDSFWSSS